jgi:hypothetical protein
MSPLTELIGGAKVYGWGSFIELPPSFESIATFTASGGETSFTFSSIPSTYQHLQIRGKAQYNNANGPASLQLRLNSNTGSNYDMHFFRGNGSATFASANAPSTRILLDSATFSNVPGDYFGSSIVDIHDYAVTTKNKTIRYFAGCDSNNTNGGQVSLGSGLFRVTAAISSIEIAVDGSYTFQSGTTFALYGIKGA